MADEPSRSEGQRGEAVRVVRTPGELEGLRSQWLALGPAHPDADPDLFLAVCALRDEVDHPHVVVREEDGRPVAMAVARVEHTRLVTRVGYRAVLRPKLRSLTVVYGGLLGPASERDSLVQALGKALDDGEADVLRVCGLREDDALTERLRREPPFWRREHGAVSGSRHILCLPATVEEYWASRSRKARSDTRRRQRRRDEAFGERLQIRAFGQGTDVSRLMADLEAVSAKTYHRGLGVGFEMTELQKRRIELGLERDWYRAWVMYLDDEPIAFTDGLRYGDTFQLGLMGFDPDPELRSFGIGNAVIARAVDQLVEDPQILVVDFGFGVNEYKLRYADDSFLEGDVLLFGPGPRAVSAGLSRSAVLGGVALAKRMLGDERITTLKREWRRRLAGGGTTED